MKQAFNRRVVIAGALAVAFSALPSANHSWGNYHWGRTTSVLTLKTGDNVDSNWDAYLNEAIGDWNTSSVIELVKVAGASNPKNCRATAGRIEACNSKYGNNGWLGIAQIWASGSHITQAVTKVNDTYFNTATYNKPEWRRLVMCQEIAHDFGLAHQDETFDNPNLGSCMDYTNDPDGGAGGAVNNDPSNEHPNSHDFSQLLTIYGHTDSVNTATASLPGSAGAEASQGSASDDHPSQWGRLVRSNSNNRVQIYERDLGNGNKMITHVFWADPDGDARASREQ